MRTKIGTLVLTFIFLLTPFLQIIPSATASSTSAYGINRYSETNLSVKAIGAVLTSDYFSNALNVMTDGNKSSGANDANSWQDHTVQTSVYWGYTYNEVYNFNTLEFTAGLNNSNSGGWYSSEPKVQVHYNGQWVDVTNQTVTPSFPGDSTSSENTYTFTFDDTYGDGIRIIGDPGQAIGKDYAYINIRELGVYYKNYGTAPTRLLAPDPSIDYLVFPVYLDGRNGSETTLEEIEKFRSDMVSIDPDAKITWAMANNYVFDEHNRPQIAKVLQYVDQHGDEIAYGIGFANNTSLDDFKYQFNEFLYMYRYMAFPELHVGGTSGSMDVWTSIHEKYRPSSIITYSINQQQTTWVKDTYGINTFMGWTATQYNVDQLTGDGSPSLLPYYSDVNSTMVPAQTIARDSGSIMMNSITVDPIGSVYTSGASRWTIHPADPVSPGAYSQIETFKRYFDNSYHDQNTLNPLFMIFDINWIYRDSALKANWETERSFLVSEASHLNIVGTKEFSNLWSTGVGATNDQNTSVISFRGNGFTVPEGHTSDNRMTYLWSETKTERLILSKLDTDSKWTIIDFTDYDRIPSPLQITTDGVLTDVSYITGRNFKIARDAPLLDSEKARIQARLIDIGFLASVNELDPILTGILFTALEYSVLKDSTVSTVVQGDYSDGITGQALTSGVSYSSDNETIASVDSATGKVTGHAPGTAVITATSQGRTATTVAKVVAPAPAPPPPPPAPPTVESLASSLSSIQLQPLQTLDCVITAALSNHTSSNVTASAAWLSGNPAVASVVGGRVTGHTPGSTFIEAAYGGKSVTIQVTVAPATPVPPTPVTPTPSGTEGTSGTTVPSTTVISTPSSPSSPTVKPEEPKGEVQPEPASVFEKMVNVKDLVTGVTTNLHQNREVAFVDIVNNWAAPEIITAARLGYVAGYDDRTFRPNQAVTRAEFTTMVVQAFDFYPGSVELKVFKDTLHHWAEKSIEELSLVGVVRGYPDQTFRPDEYVSRAEIVEILSRIMNMNSLTAKGHAAAFKDVDHVWNRDKIRELAAVGIVNGKSVDRFDPLGKCTRAEAAALILRILKLQPEINEVL